MVEVVVGWWAERVGEAAVAAALMEVVEEVEAADWQVRVDREAGVEEVRDRGRVEVEVVGG